MFPNRIWGIFLRILLTGVLIVLLDLAPQPHSFRQGLDQARQAMNRQDLVSASQYIDQAAAGAAWRADLPLLAASWALQAGLPLQAIQILEQPTVASRLSADDLLLLGDAYQQAGNQHMAAAIWKRAAGLAPSPEISQRLAEYHQAQRDYPAAIQYLHQLLRYSPGDARLNYRLGLLYAATDPEAGLAYLSQAAELDPAFHTSALELQRKIRTATLYSEPAYTFTAAGRALAGLNEWELAEAAFRQAAQLRPDYAEAWAFLGEARQHSSTATAYKYPGLAELQRALILDAESVSANLLMGLYCLRQGEYALAIRYIQYTLTLEPDNPLLVAELANALAQQGDLPAAQAAYQQAIDLAPDDPLFYRLLAEFSLSHHIQIREIALPAARTAVILAPQDLPSLDILGLTLLTLEDTLNAERFLLQAMELDPRYAPAHLHLGMLYILRGEMDQGLQELELAETLGSGTSTAEEAQRFISHYYP